MVSVATLGYDQAVTPADRPSPALPAPTGVPMRAPDACAQLPSRRGGDATSVATVATGPTTIALSWGTCTHPGKVRRLNEDSLLAEPPVFVVADGMGGHAGGDVASAMAIEAMGALAGRSSVRAIDVEAAVRSANRAIGVRAATSAQVMGTTLSGLVVGRSAVGDEVLVVNVGDSRTYLWRDGTLAQLSTDHSHVQELVDAGLLDPADAANHPERNVVTRALGVDDDIEIDIRGVQVVPGDRFVICSDGLTTELDNAAIVAELGAAGARGAAEALVARVLDGRAGDNVTVVVVDVVAIEPADRDADRTDPRPRRVRDHAPGADDDRSRTSALIDAVPLNPADLTTGRAEPADG